MTVALGAFLLGTAGQEVTSRNVRLSLGATWRPSSAALGALSGVVYGPAGSMGEATLVNPTTLGVNPFVAVVQGTHSAVQGQYHVPNDTYRTLAITAQHASQWRRALWLVTVDDAEAAGVASSPTTDRARLHMLDGALSASAPGALPALPANSLVLGEVAIPPTGNAVTITPYNPRTTARGGILPVANDSSVLPGHGGALPAHDGEYRDHPSNGLQRGLSGGWAPPVRRAPGCFIEGSAGNLPIGSGANSHIVVLDLASYVEDWTYDAGNGRATCQRAGRYLCSGGIGVSGNGAGRRYVHIFKNGVQITAAGNSFIPSAMFVNSLQLPTAAFPVRMEAGNYLQLSAFQDSGSTLNILRNFSFLSAQWLGDW